MSANLFAFLKRAIEKRPAAAALVAGLAAALLASAYLARRESEILRVAQPSAALIAARDIGPGETIDRSALESATVPLRFIQPGAIGEISEAEGRVALVPVRKGAQLTRSIARRADDKVGLASLLPSGTRAFSLSLPRSRAAGGLVRPGDRVDIMATFDLGSGPSSEITTLAMAADVRVAAVESRLEGAPEPQAEKKQGLFSGAASQGQWAREISVTLVVSSAQARVLAFAQQSGAISLAVRPPYDEETEDEPAPITISSIAEGAGGVVPLRKPFKEYRGAR